MVLDRPFESVISFRYMPNYHQYALPRRLCDATVIEAAKVSVSCDEGFKDAIVKRFRGGELECGPCTNRGASNSASGALRIGGAMETRT